MHNTANNVRIVLAIISLVCSAYVAYSLIASVTRAPAHQTSTHIPEEYLR